LDDADDGPVEGLLASQHQDVHNSFAAEACTNLEAFAGDNLVAPPSKVRTLPHHYMIHRFHIVSKLYCMEVLTGMKVKIFIF
jgi:hypothetical protein